MVLLIIVDLVVRAFQRSVARETVVPVEEYVKIRNNCPKHLVEGAMGQSL
jgi:hypothetical protein